jgi:hypothetical protein
MIPHDHGIVFRLLNGKLEIMGIRQKIRDWNDARLAENFRRAVPSKQPSVKELNAALVKAVNSHNFKLAAAIKEAGGTPDIGIPYDFAGDLHHTPYLSQLVRREDETAVRCMIGLGVDVNRKDDYKKESPLLIAAVTGNTRICRMLLEAGAEDYCTSDSFVSDYPRQTARKLAAEKGYTDIVKLIDDEPQRRIRVAEEKRNAEIRAEQERKDAETREAARIAAAALAIANKDPSVVQTGEDITVQGPLKLKGSRQRPAL